MNDTGTQATTGGASAPPSSRPTPERFTAHGHPRCPSFRGDVQCTLPAGHRRRLGLSHEFDFEGEA